jgi:transcriptional regulator with XRE-family HTH domain
MPASNKKLMRSIGSNLQKARKEKRYTQEEVAKSVNLTANYYARLERGEATASLETLYDLFAVLGVKASEVLPEKA